MHDRPTPFGRVVGSCHWTVRQADLDSMHTPGFDVPELELWALKRSKCTDIPVNLTQTNLTTFAASNMAALAPSATRQKVLNNMQSQSRSGMLQKQQEFECLEYKVLDACSCMRAHN